MYIALYEPEIPNNVGAIMRTCACFGYHLLLIEPFGFLLEDRNFRRAKMDYNPKFTIFPSFRDFMDDYKNNRKILFTPHTTFNANKFNFLPEDILFFGRESNGVENEIAMEMDAMIAIQMDPRCRSLNLAMSVSIGITLSIN